MVCRETCQTFLNGVRVNKLLSSLVFDEVSKSANSYLVQPVTILLLDICYYCCYNLDIWFAILLRRSLLIVSHQMLYFIVAATFSDILSNLKIVINWTCINLVSFFYKILNQTSKHLLNTSSTLIFVFQFYLFFYLFIPSRSYILLKIVLSFFVLKLLLKNQNLFWLGKFIFYTGFNSN